jgi:hypothetical protein
MSSRTKIPVGNGKFCHSGPECRIHGARWRVNNLLVVENTTELAANFDERVAALDEGFAQEICNHGKSFKHLSELGKKALYPGQSARYCEEHEAYHAYANQNSPHKVAVNKLQDSITRAVKDGVISQEESSELRSRIGKFIGTTIRPKFNDDKEHMQTLQRQYQRDPNSGSAKDARDERRNQKAKAQGHTPYLLKPRDIPELRVPVEKVPDSLMLEFWKCGRKKRYDSVDIAKAKAQEVVSDEEEMTPYSCSYCDKHHIGHGDGSDPDEVQLERARSLWVKVPSKSNMFAFAKGLIN